MGRTILRVDSSTADDGASATRQMTQAIVDGLLARGDHARVVEVDLAGDALEHLHGRPDVDNPHLAQFMAADTVVIGAPMYNFTIPSQLKAWIDRIVVAGQTFRYGAQGPVGLAGGKRVFVASAAGGIHGQATNFVDPYLRAVLGFIGINDARFIQAHGMAMQDVRDLALAGAIEQATQAVRAA